MKTEISFAPSVPYITITVTTEEANASADKITKAAIETVKNDGFFHDYDIYDSKVETEHITNFYARTD